MNHLGLFEGIGGFSLAARWANWKTVGWVEINPFCQKVLKYHFPEAQGFGDIKKFSYAVFKSILRNKGIRDRSIDIITGGFPCQPYSSAGLRKGTDDPRYLWPNMLETIRQFKPTWVVGENVRGITNWSGGLVFEQVQVDLEAIGYEVQAFILPACAVDAPHRRDRVWFVAYSRDNGLHGRKDRQGMGKGNDSDTARAKETIEFEGCSKQGAAIITNSSDARAKSVRRKRENTIHEPGITSNTITEQRERQVRGLESKFVAGCEWAIAYTKREGLERRDRSRKSIRPESGSEKVAANSDRTGLQKLNIPEQPGCSGHSSRCNNADAAYSDSFRRIQSDCKPESRQLAKEIPNWGQFPTQSPLCGRNDGVSTGLVGITFSRHRRESIQAYGNAIVPQVAYQIFKSINEHERATTKGSIRPGL